MNTKRTVHVLAIPPVLLALTALVGGDPQPAPGNTEQRWRIQPGPVVPVPGPPGKPSRVAGSFKLVKDPHGAVSKSGGGCLIFQPTDERRPCQGSAAGCPVAGLGEFAYCVDSSCWVKKDEGQCLKFPGGLEEGKVYTLPESGANDLPLGPSRPVAWRVVTCQNLVPGGCGGGDPAGRQLDYGPIRRH